MKRFAVIGLGKFGFHTAKALFDDGNEVVAIDKDKAKVHSIDYFSTEAIVLDATDNEILKTLGLENMDAVIVSTGSNISNSILLCLYLQEIGVKKILAKAIDDDHAKILKRMGATDVIHPERDMALRISQALSQPNILDYIPLAAGYNIVQVEAPRKFTGKSLKDLHLRVKYKVYVIGIKDKLTDNLLLIPPADYEIKNSDILIMIGKSESIRKIKALK